MSRAKHMRQRDPAVSGPRGGGAALAEKLMAYANRTDVVVLALPRGGVPVAFEVAEALNAPLDVFLVRKLGVPGHEELAMGAIAAGGVRVLNAEVVRLLHIPDEVIEAVAAREQRELDQRAQRYRDGRPAHGRTWAHGHPGGRRSAPPVPRCGPRCRPCATSSQLHLVIAVLLPPGVRVRSWAAGKEVVCAATPEPFYAVGLWYEDFSQTSDAEVRDLLAWSASGTPRRPTAPRPLSDERRGLFGPPSRARGRKSYAKGRF